MKNAIAVICFLVGGTTSCFAQDYVPMLDTVNEWKFTTCNFGCITDTYYTDGDTIVDGTTYKILDGYHYISRGFLLHEDVAEKQISIKMLLPSGTEDYLLYDFSLEVGDTFQMNNPITPFPNDGGLFVLDEISSKTLADGKSYRHFYFSPAPGNTQSTEEAVWIEGIGSLSIINAPGGHPDINEVGHLSCFFKDGERVYENLDSITECVPDVLGISDMAHSFNTVLLYQNNGTVFLENTTYIRLFSVYDVTGVKITDGINSNRAAQFSFNIANYANGLYLVRMLDANGNKQVLKFVVR